MIRRRLAVLLALALASLVLPFINDAAQAAGRKTGGVFTIEDDLLGGSAGGTQSGGGAQVTGAIGQTATDKLTLGPLTGHGGFFRFPFPFQRLLIVLPGEAPNPDSPTGRDGAPEAQVVNSTFTVLVRASDLLWDQFASGDTVRLFSSAGTIADQALSAGATLYANVVLTTTGTHVLSAIDISNFTIPTATAAITIVPASPGPPTASLAIEGSTVATLGGALAGRAVDASAVSRLIVSLKNTQSGLWLAGWNGTQSFTSAMPVIGTATFADPNRPRTEWSLPLPDAAFADGITYEAHIRVTNPTGYYSDTVASFTFNASGLAFAPDDGQGSAAALPAISSGCEPVDVSLVYTVGPKGLKPGGALAARVPDGWRIQSVGGFNSAGVSTTVVVAPPSFSSATLGPGWLLLSVPSGPGFVSGNTLTLKITGLPPLDSRGRGAQTFELREQSGPGGALKPIASFPSLTLDAGTTSYLAFEDASPIAIGPAQFSPVMRVKHVDLCGNAKSTTTVQTALLSVGRPGAAGFAPDPGAVFLSGATGQPISAVTFASGLSESTSFFYLTTNPGGLSFEVLRASWSVLSEAETTRAVTLATAAIAVASLSVDTGTLAPGATSAAFAAPAAGYVRLRASAAGVPWEVTLSTGGASFYPPLSRASGLTTSGGETVAWSGADELGVPARALPAGAYRVRVSLGGGTVIDATRELRVTRSALIAGQLAAAGARALVSARGPGLGAARTVLASSTGYFEVWGLSAGSSYSLYVSTLSGSAGARGVVLSTTVANVAAGTVIPGTIALPAAARLRVSAQGSGPAPREVFGSVTARDASGEAVASGVLRFAAGSASSDDGALGFGVTASTWTSLYLPSGAYALDLSAPEVGLSTRVAVSAPADLAVVFPRRANLVGVVIAASTGPLGVPAAVEATPFGSDAPRRFASAAVPAGLSSAAFTLYGLDPGSWTVTARAPGLLPASSTFLVVEDVDLGVATAPAAALTLAAGGVVSGTVTFAGDTRGLGTGSFDATLEAYDPATFETRSTLVRLATSVSSSSAAYSIGGLRSGLWSLRASVPGFSLALSTVSISTPAASAADLVLTEQLGRLALSLVLPPRAGGGCRLPAEFDGVGVECGGGVLAASTVTLHCSSMTALMPALAPGVYRARAAFRQTGALASASYSLVAGSTTAGALDLSISTLPVAGSLVITGYAADASSPAAIIARAPTTSYLLLGSTSALVVSALRVELRDAAGVAYVSSVSADGSFAFAVSPGVYRLRVPGDLDLDPANGPELAEVSRLVIASAPVSGLVVTVSRGARVSGRAALPPGASGGGSARALLLGDNASLETRALFSPGASEAAFAFAGVPLGRYTLTLEDAGAPARFAPASRELTVGGDLDAGILALSASGGIVGRAAVERVLADGTTAHALVTAAEASALSARALPTPWRSGGDRQAALDAEGRFAVTGLAPGRYDLVVGGGRVASIAVAEGQVVDAGVVVLRAGPSVSGRVTDAATGAPAPNVRISAGDAETRTDASGRYVLSGLDPLSPHLDVTAGAEDAGPAYEARTSFGVDARSTQTVDFSLLPARFTVSGRVSGLRAGPATLLLQRAGRQPLDGYTADFQSETAADGSFALRTATGAFRLTILAEGFAPLRLAPVVSSGSVSLGVLSLAASGAVSGAVSSAGGAPVSPEDADAVLAATADLGDVVPGSLVLDAAGRSVVGYSVAGLKPGLSYRLIFASKSGGASVAATITAQTTVQDVILKPAAPSARARARRVGPAYALTFELSRPLRARKTADDDLSSILTGGAGTILDRKLSSDRRRLTAVYAPAVGESTFTFRVNGYTADADPDSSSVSDPELVLDSTSSFVAGADASASEPVSNLLGATISLDGSASRVLLPRGAFAIDGASSAVVSLRATGSTVDVAVSSGARSSLVRPAELSVEYSTAADPSKLNVYWFNPAANAYVLVPNPTVDRVNRTLTVKVDHFSSFALFESAASVIGGAQFNGGEIDAFNFPNPFDLRTKTVTKLHPGGGSLTETIRGTLLRVALPPGLSGHGAVRVFNTAGEKIRTIDLGELSGGRFFYAEWDGRTDGGSDAASGVYIAEIRVGRKSRFIRMALVK